MNSIAKPRLMKTSISPILLAGALAYLNTVDTSIAATILRGNDSGSTPFTIGTISAPGNHGSNVNLEAPGNGDFETSAGIAGVVGTPGIALSWSSRNTSASQDWRMRPWNINGLSGGGAFQIRGTNLGGTHFIEFTPVANAAVVINSFNFLGDRDNPGQPYQYHVDVVDIAAETVVKRVVTPQWETDVTLTPENSGTWAGAPVVEVNFTGLPGRAYRLDLTRIVGPAPDAPSARSELDIAVDNISIDQIDSKLWVGGTGNFNDDSGWLSPGAPTRDDRIMINTGTATNAGDDGFYHRDAPTLIDGGNLVLQNLRLINRSVFEILAGSFTQNDSTYFMVSISGSPGEFNQSGGMVTANLSRGFFLSDGSGLTAAYRMTGGTLDVNMSGIYNTDLHNVHIGRGPNSDDLFLVDGGVATIRNTNPALSESVGRFAFITGDSTLHVRSGLLEVFRFLRIDIGHDINTSNSVNPVARMIVEDGEVNVEVADAVRVGSRLSGKLEVNGGALRIRKAEGMGGNLILRANDGHTSEVVHIGGLIEVEGDVILGSAGDRSIDATGTATYQMHGGTLRAAQITRGSNATANFEFHRGLLVLEGDQSSLPSQSWFTASGDFFFRYDPIANRTIFSDEPIVFDLTDSIAYQGFLMDENKRPVGMDANGNSNPVNVMLTLRLFDAQTAGALLHTERHVAPVDRGSFGVYLGNGSPLLEEPYPGLATLFAGEGAGERFLEVTWQRIGSDTTTTIQPRIRMLGAPYAFTSAAARNLLNPDGQKLIDNIDGVLNLSGSLLSTGSISVSSITAAADAVTGINAPNITSGQFNSERFSLPASRFTTGTIPVGRLPDLNSRLPDIDASRITSGTLHPDRLPQGLGQLPSTVNFTNRQTFNRDLIFNTSNNVQALAMNDRRIVLGSENRDGFVGYVSNFSGVQIDGPQLMARNRGALASKVPSSSNYRVNLEWENSGRATIYGTLNVHAQGSSFASSIASGRGINQSSDSEIRNATNNFSIITRNRIGAASFLARSDSRLKHHIQPALATDETQALLSLRVVDYVDREDGSQRRGFIAQEVQKVMPDAVSLTASRTLPCGEEVEDFLSVDYQRIFNSALVVTQDLIKRDRARQIRISQLEAKLDGIEENSRALEAVPTLKSGEKQQPNSF